MLGRSSMCSSMCSSITSTLSGFTRLKTHSKRISVLYILIWKQWLASSRTQLWVQKPAHLQTCSEAFTELAEGEKNRRHPNLSYSPGRSGGFCSLFRISKINRVVGKSQNHLLVCASYWRFSGLYRWLALRVPLPTYVQNSFSS